MCNVERLKESMIIDFQYLSIILRRRDCDKRVNFHKGEKRGKNIYMKMFTGFGEAHWILPVRLVNPLFLRWLIDDLCFRSHFLLMYAFGGVKTYRDDVRRKILDCLVWVFQKRYHQDQCCDDKFGVHDLKRNDWITIQIDLNSHILLGFLKNVRSALILWHWGCWLRRRWSGTWRWSFTLHLSSTMLSTSDFCGQPFRQLRQNIFQDWSKPQHRMLAILIEWH